MSFVPQTISIDIGRSMARFDQISASQSEAPMIWPGNTQQPLRSAGTASGAR